jgi:alpha-ketoglutarate-dependent 2,4-dichlorophenoxyacetate dioxygenase
VVFYPGLFFQSSELPMKLRCDNLHPEFGAYVLDIDLSQALDSGQIDELDKAINRYSLLLFENQTMDDESHIALTRALGPLEEEHVVYYGSGKVTYIGIVGNIDARGNRIPEKRVQSQKGNQMRHSDSSFREIPAKYSILCAYEVPDQGGETEFASARSAYNRLDQKTQQRIEGEVGIHDYIYSRTQVSEDAVNQSQRTYMHPVRQRLVRKNPLTGDKNIFVGSHVKEIEGWSDADAKPLIKGLIDEITRPESVYRHQWKAGDLMIWDNRCIVHRGCGYDPDTYRRRMHQTRVRCDGPSLGEDL